MGLPAGRFPEPGAYPLAAIVSILPCSVTSETVFKDCPLSLGQNCPWLRTTATHALRSCYFTRMVQILFSKVAKLCSLIGPLKGNGHTFKIKAESLLPLLCLC